MYSSRLTIHDKLLDAFSQCAPGRVFPGPPARQFVHTASMIQKSTGSLEKCFRGTPKGVQPSRLDLNNLSQLDRKAPRADQASAYLQENSTYSCSLSLQVSLSKAASFHESQDFVSANWHKSSSHRAYLPGLARIGLAPYELAPRGCSLHQSESRHSVVLLAHRFSSMLATF